MYYLKDKNGKYDMYIDGKYAVTVDQIFDESIPVYFDMEEIK